MQVAFLKSWGHCSTKCSCSQCPFLGEEARAEEGCWGVGEEEHQERRPAVGESRAVVLLYIPELSRQGKGQVLFISQTGHK